MTPIAGEQFGLVLRAEDAYVRALLIFGSIEEAALVEVELPNLLVYRANAIHVP